MSALLRASDESLALAREILGDAARVNEPIAKRTTYRVGGSAALYLEIDSEADLELAVRAVRSSGVPVLVLGAGSNMLIADAGYYGLCLSLGSNYSDVEMADGSLTDGEVIAGGGCAFPVLSRQLAASGWSGMEWAVGIPGSVGGAVAMNAGGHGSQTRDRLVQALVIDLTSGVLAQRDPCALGLSYRHSNLGRFDLVLGARFRVEREEPARCQAMLDEIVRWRREHQPGGRNAGSVFANPPGDSAGHLIDSAGLKGHRIGSAVVSDKHANFFVVDKDGHTDDVAALVSDVASTVAQRLGVTLEPEVRLIGFEQ